MLHFINSHKKLLFASVASAVLLSLVVYTTYVLNVDTFYKGILLDGHDISDMSLIKAKSVLEDKINNKYENQELVIIYGAKSWRLDTKDISLKLHTEDALKNAFDIGRSGNIINRLFQIISLRFEAVDIRPVISYKTEKIKNLLNEVKKSVDKNEKNASVNYKDGNINIEKEIVGKTVPVDKNLELIENRIIENSFGNIELYVENKIPLITYNDLKEINGVIASFKTSFSPKDANRSHNIKLGCERLNNSILMPNDIFSMNQALGPRTLENGYKEAPIIFKNELVPGTGGGVCQITSTLYNAVLLSKNEVIQRTHHSWPLGYVDPGRDATIAEDYIDFKFQNTSGYPIALNTEVIGNQLFIRILGKDENNGQVVRLKNEIIEVYEPGDEEVIVDNSVPENERLVLREAKKGMKVVVYRETYNGSGELMDREKISEDIYKPVKAQVKINQNYQNNTIDENQSY